MRPPVRLAGGHATGFTKHGAPRHRRGGDRARGQRGDGDAAHLPPEKRLFRAVGELGGLSPPPRPGGGSTAGAPVALFVGGRLGIVGADGVAWPAVVTAIARGAPGAPGGCSPALALQLRVVYTADGATEILAWQQPLRVRLVARTPASSGPRRPTARWSAMSGPARSRCQGCRAGPPTSPARRARPCCRRCRVASAGLWYSGCSSAERRSTAATGRARS
jgi:hypothetical protein